MYIGARAEMCVSRTYAVYARVVRRNMLVFVNRSLVPIHLEFRVSTSLSKLFSQKIRFWSRDHHERRSMRGVWLFMD